MTGIGTDPIPDKAGAKTMYDEDKAKKELSVLPPDARLHLQHVCRNGLQTIACMIEAGSAEEAKDEVMRLAVELRTLGL
jgi:hypothetical protein